MFICLKDLTADLELHNWAIDDSLGGTPKGGPETCHHNFDPLWKGWLSPALIAWRPIREIERFTVAQIKEDFMHHTLDPFADK